MERLTEKKSFLSYHSLQPVNVVKIGTEEEFKVETMNNVYLVGSAIDKLAEYENTEEQGKLIRLPCKIWDVLWCTDNKKVEGFIVKEFKICAYKINRVEIYFENASGFGLCLFDGTLDEGWFLTKEEAEQALAKMEEK